MGIPDDLCELFGARPLVYRVLQAIHETNAAFPGEPADTSSEERVLRTLLLYAYARGVYGSRDIEELATHDETASYICAGLKPGWFELRHLRRQLGRRLREDLLHLFRGVIQTLRERSLSTLRGRIEEAASQEAEVRLRRAIQADSMAMDD